MMNNNVLNLRVYQSINLLKTWGKSYFRTANSIIFRNDKPMGFGLIAPNSNKISSNIIIGIKPLSNSGLNKFDSMKDSEFVKIGITMFHEFSHYDSAFSSDESEDILMSDLSKQGNKDYYLKSWHKLPHEIDAEYNGVIGMWDHLEMLCPEYADKLMISHLNRRATRTLYPIACPENGFQSKEQVEKLFEEAYDRSLLYKREFPVDFLRQDNEFSRMFTDDCKTLRSEYIPFHIQLVKAESGQELDLKMASLVSYIHPELQKDYPGLDFKLLNPESVFGIPMPESFDEIRNRVMIDLSNSFTDAVLYVTDLMKQDADNIL